MSIKEQIISTLRATGRKGIENVINYMVENDFFTVSCYHHHRYRGGMADHAWQTYLIAQRAQQKNIKRHPSAPNLSNASLAICALLHDICDCSGLPHIHGHGSRSARMLKHLGLTLSSDEYLAIRFHMSLRTHQRHPQYQAARHCHLRYLIHNADHDSAKIGRGCDNGGENQILL